ncbi:metallophosphoesterase [Halalkaliarchaeum sp. AArc-GB]|uniref:metallophosphoesterase n=1 Tax=Halalkaliarchaeum sp. AArc-GB TaxID=3074078 RepID=UPI0028594F58|nr:metallophosphoesterase [Halalkaliarchaeum sp. AArc-GB]MDR5671710.1 metallophosphoesterase [Halalkaliarchaeum sp. AArc-GB]
MAPTPVEPIPNAPAAIVDGDGKRALVVADYHAGIEIGLRYERGVELDSAADSRRERLLSLLDRTDGDRVIVLGDLAHRLRAPDGEEREELETLIGAVTDRVPLTLVQGNHDGGVAAAFADRIDVAPTDGTVYGSVGLVHGHTWPAREVLEADVVCVGHEHPQVRLRDEVGGTRVERAWLRGTLDPEPFRREGIIAEEAAGSGTELVVFPAFNDRSGGTWVNVEGQSFLSPFLPAGLAGGEAYLLDGTRLGPFETI